MSDDLMDIYYRQSVKNMSQLLNKSIKDFCDEHGLLPSQVEMVVDNFKQTAHFKVKKEVLLGLDKKISAAEKDLLLESLGLSISFESPNYIWEPIKGVIVQIPSDELGKCDNRPQLIELIRKCGYAMLANLEDRMSEVV